MRSIHIFLTVLLFSCNVGCCQPGAAKNTSHDQLRQKVTDNLELLKDSPEQAFAQISPLLLEVREFKDKEAELLLLSQRCTYYYYHKVSFEMIIESAKALKEKAYEYDEPFFQSDANLFLFDAYCLNKLYSKALNELQEGFATLNNVSPPTDKVIMAKAKLYIAYANYYNTQGDTQKEIQNLKAANDEDGKIKNTEIRREALFKDYSNYADVYSNLGKMDSAKHYATKSINLGDPKSANSRSMYKNYVILGEFYKHKKEYRNAIAYFLSAEKISTENNFLNLERLYADMIDVYGLVGNAQAKEKYEYKLKDLKLLVSEKKNQSLHKIIEETEKNDRSKAYLYTVIGAVGISIFLLSLVIYFRKKNKLLEQQELASQEYLLARPGPQKQSYKGLVEMAKNDDPAFMAEFHKAFPDFREKLQSVNNSVVQSEVEFCALLKLKLTTKDIARYKNIEPKTVQNKKYRIRRKLGIPESVDIYFWFDQM